MITEKEVLQALLHVEEPDLKKDIVTLGMVKNVEVSESKISFTIVLTTPACPLKELIKSRCVEAIHQYVQTQIEVDVKFTAEVTSTREGTSQLLKRVKNIIAVASGKGGVGKSTVTSNLAVALAKSGAKVGLIDADIYGPSIPVMFGLEGQQPEMVKHEGKDYIVPMKKYGIELISIGLLIPADSAVVWRGPMASSALRQFLSDVWWSDLDYLLLDMPPGTGDIHLTLVQSVPVTGAIIVTTPQKVALADAQKALAMFRQPQINVPVLGIIENMAYFTPEELPSNKYYIFGKDGGKTLAQSLQVPFLGEVPLVQSIRESGDSGAPVVTLQEKSSLTFQEIAGQVAQQVAIRNSSMLETKKVDILV